ncbi:MAG: hypothetical protein ACRYFS_20615 [Janthinobacterium lividum]
MTVHDVIFVIGIYIFLSVLGRILQSIWPILGPAPNVSEQRLARLESKINQILEHLGVEQEPALDKVQKLIVLGRRVEAIKMYREQTGVSLVIAKEAVLGIEAQMKVSGLVGL